MSKELFLKVRSLAQKKRKNEEVVPMDQLTTKYKVPYENLCNELKESQKQLRMDYMESIRTVTDFVSETVYADFSSNEEWKRVLERYGELYKQQNELTNAFLIAFINLISKYDKEAQ